MKTISKINKQGSYKISTKTIDGITVSVLLQALATTTLVTGDLVDPDQLIFRGVLRRDGHETEMFNHTLRQLVILSYISSVPYQWLTNLNQDFVHLDVTGFTGIMPLRFDFGGPINLEGNDEFTLTWILNDGFWKGVGGTNAGSIDPDSSTIEIDDCESTDTEYFIPITKSWVIETNQNNATENIGDNILNLVVVNYDKTDTYSANKVINSLSLKSKQMSKDETFAELVNKKMSYYATDSEALRRFQNFIIYQGHQELDEVTINISLNSSQVAAAKNWILARSFVTSSAAVTRGIMIDAKKDQENDKKGRFDSSLAVKAGH